MDMQMEKKNDLVKYSNIMNQIAFTKFTTTDYNFLMMLCSKLRNQETNKMVFSFKEIKELVNYRSNHTAEHFAMELKRMNQKMMNISSTIETENEILMFVLFPTFTVNKKEQTLTVAVNESFKFILNELTKEFTEFDLRSFTLLESKYSKTLYRKLKQFKFSGFYKVKVDELRRIMDVPKSYSNNTFLNYAINPALKELKEYIPNLRMEIIREKKRGAPISGFVFKFDKQEQKDKPDIQMVDEPGIIDAEVVEAEIKAEEKKEEEIKSQTYNEMDEYLRKLAR